MFNIVLLSNIVVYVWLKSYRATRTVEGGGYWKQSKNGDRVGVEGKKQKGKPFGLFLLHEALHLKYGKRKKISPTSSIGLI